MDSGKSIKSESIEVTDDRFLSVSPLAPRTNEDDRVQILELPTGLHPPGTKIRGRPRKYGTEGVRMTSTLTPIPVPGSAQGVPEANVDVPPGFPPRPRRMAAPATTGGASSSKPQTGRACSNNMRKPEVGLDNLGKLPGLPSCGHFVSQTVHVCVGQDVVDRIISISNEWPYSVCIFSATGFVSTAVLWKPASEVPITYEGVFKIMSLSGSFTPCGPDKDKSSRAGGLSISFADPDGRVIRGVVGGSLIAATNVQISLGIYP